MSSNAVTTDDGDHVLIVSEREIQNLKEYNLQLQQNLQQATETIAQLQKSASQSKSELFCNNSDNELSDWFLASVM